MDISFVGYWFDICLIDKIPRVNIKKKCHNWHLFSFLLRYIHTLFLGNKA